MPHSGRNLLTISLCLLLAACGTSGSRCNAAPVIPDTGNEHRHGDWFCQVNEAGEVWECVRDPRLAQKPVSDGSPELARPEPTPTVTVQLSTAADAPVPDPLLPDADPMTAGMAGFETRSDAVTTPAESEQLPGRIPHAAEAPDWQHLAYRPAVVTPLNELPAQFYTVQIVAMSSMETLESFRKEYRLSGVLGARLEAGGRIYYALLLGVYETLADAKAAAASRPGSIQHMEPWIRKLGPLQEAVLRAGAISD